MSLTTSRTGYKPFEYPWAYEFWLKQQQVHWLPEEVPMADDVKDWNYKLDDVERHLLSQIFRFFTQGDIEVNDNYMERYARVFKPTEVKMMLSAFSNMETIHVAAYATLLETIGMPETEFSAFMQYEAMKAKHDYMQTFNVDDPGNVALTLAMFGGFTEGLQLFASFAMLMNFPRFNKMKGMGQIVSWSIRDETLHCHGINRLYHTWVAENADKIDMDWLHREIDAGSRKVVEIEDAFIDDAFSLGPVQGLTADEVKAYIRFMADVRRAEYGLPPAFHIQKNPLPWLDQIVGGVEHANFFEARATEYSKAATKGDWADVFW